MRHVKLIWVLSTLLMLMSHIDLTGAQDYPSKPIRLISPFGTGGGADVFARVIGRKLTESWGQQVIVENRVGAGGTVGTEIVARAPPDGYTLLLLSNTHAINPGFYKKLPFDPIKDFAAVSLVATSVNVLVVHPSLPVRSVAHLIALARKRPGELTFGSGGVGATTHLAGELFKNMANINVIHVPYKGSGPAEIDLAGGHVQYMLDTMPAALPNVKAGRTLALATTGEKRSRSLPHVPTVSESGLRGYAFAIWYGIAASSGTPQPVISKLNGEIVRIMSLPDVQEFSLSQGTEARTSSSEEFASYIKTEIDFYAKIIARAGIKPE